MLTVAEAIELSTELAKAPSVLPKHAKSAAEILACILAGQELGWGPMAALRGLQLVSGKLTIDASAMLGLVVRAGVQIAWEKDGSDGVARLKLVRGSMSHVHQFTRDDAKKANLNSDTWKKYEASMLRARCVSAAVRAFCPDVLAGTAAYLPGEADDGDESPAGAPVVETKPSRALDTPLDKDITSVASDAQFAPTRTLSTRAEPPALTPEQSAAVAKVQEHFPGAQPERHSKEEMIAQLVKIDLPQCTTLEHLSAVAGELVALHGPVKATDPWNAFAARCKAVGVSPRDAVNAAQKAA